jgi:PTH1 family peptidyl-tRNA hydrolase
MEYLIIGLGNPGNEYLHTRHNLGFIFVDFIVNKLGLNSNDFSFNKNFNAEILKYNTILFLKPMTFMNNSGYSVSKAINYYDFKNIYLIYDDLDLHLGDFKIGEKSPKSHNGVISTKEQINQEFISIRIGINSDRNPNITGADYVLGKISKEEQEILITVFENIIKQLTFL